MGFFLVNFFTQQNLFFFFIFFEAVLIPMFLLIGIWGPRKVQRVDAAYRFFMYTFLGSIPMLLAIFYIYSKVGTVNWFYFAYHPSYHDAQYYLSWFNTRWWAGRCWKTGVFQCWKDFGLQTFMLYYLNPITIRYEILKSDFISSPIFTPYEEVCLWFSFFISFAVKIPLVPFHTWLPEAHVEAPTPVSMILASVLLKMGGYGYLHFSLILFPFASSFCYNFYTVCCLLSILYGCACAMTHIDFKKIVAYSSISHMGYSMLVLGGLPSSQALDGCVITMISHGFVSLAMFFSIGFLYERYGTRTIPYYTNVSILHPSFSFFFLFFCLANMGFPGTSGFVGELLILIYLMKINFGCSLIAAFSIIFSSVYNLWMFNRICWGSQAVNQYSKAICFVAFYNNIRRIFSYYFQIEKIRESARISQVFFYNFFIKIRYTVYEKLFFDIRFCEFVIFIILMFFILFIGLFPTHAFPNLSSSTLYYNSIIFSHTDRGSFWLTGGSVFRWWIWLRLRLLIFVFLLK
jgi:proton-translocating NADH-quinone oxidoreductase chain M